MMNMLTLKQQTKTLNVMTKSKQHIKAKPTHVSDQLNSHIKPTNHKHQKDINNLSKPLQKLSVSNEQSHNKSHENRQIEKQILKKNAIVHFQLKDSKDLKYAKIISRSGKVAGK